MYCIGLRKAYIVMSSWESMHLNKGEPLGGGKGNREGEGVQFTANRGQERKGIRATA